MLFNQNFWKCAIACCTRRLRSCRREAQRWVRWTRPQCPQSVLSRHCVCCAVQTKKHNKTYTGIVSRIPQKILSTESAQNVWLLHIWMISNTAQQLFWQSLRTNQWKVNKLMQWLTWGFAKMMCSALYLLTDCVKRRLLLHYFVLHKFTRPGGGVWRGVEIQDQKVQAGLRLEGGQSCHAILPFLLSFFVRCAWKCSGIGILVRLKWKLSRIKRYI